MKWWFWEKKWNKKQWEGKSQASWECWESSWLLMLAFARCVSLHFHRVFCLRHVKIAAAKSWGGSSLAMGTMAWLRAGSTSPLVLHRQSSARSWLVRAFCMEIGLTSMSTVWVCCHIAYETSWVEVCKAGSTKSLMDFDYILIYLGKDYFILVSLFKFIFVLWRTRVLF